MTRRREITRSTKKNKQRTPRDRTQPKRKGTFPLPSVLSFEAGKLSEAKFIKNFGLGRREKSLWSYRDKPGGEGGG